MAYNPQWPNLYEQEAQQLKGIFEQGIIDIQHFGSTAIPTIYAKPTIDMLMIVKDLGVVLQFNPQLECLGYTALGEVEIPNRLLYQKKIVTENTVQHSHHLHIYPVNHPEIQRHLDFRDYLLAHPDEAEQYSTLKIQLAKQFALDIESYIEGKSAFVREIERKAKELKMRQ